MTVRFASPNDFDILRSHDRHISAGELLHSIAENRALVISYGGTFAGWLRYNLFWDNTPFLNMLFILEDFRGKGCGKLLMNFWEAEMAKAGYKAVLTSTVSSEDAQFFYRKLGYTDCGALLLPGEPLEIILRKNFNYGA